MNGGLRVYHDPLHGAIALDRAIPAEAMAIAIIDTPAFQRLRRIRQLGPAHLTFHGAESSRFTHSLGVLHLARRALHHLERSHPHLAEHRVVLYAAALLHDIGHGPFSHSGEEMFGISHEAWSARLIREDGELRGPLEAAQKGCAEAVATLLEGGDYAEPAIKALVSSQLDCDRLDYLLRDSYSTGARYGQLDLDRLLAALILAPDGSLAIHPRGLLAVEHYLVVRQLMYRSVYNHRLNVVCNWLLKRTIDVARQLGPQQVWADEAMADWLWNKEHLTLGRFLANDDVRTTYHLSRWRDDAPPRAAGPLHPPSGSPAAEGHGCPPPVHSREPPAPGPGPTAGPPGRDRSGRVLCPAAGPDPGIRPLQKWVAPLGWPASGRIGRPFQARAYPHPPGTLGLVGGSQGGGGNALRRALFKVCCA